MPNTQAMAASFKSEVMSGIHALGTSVVRAGTGADTLKGAIFYATGSLGPATTVYSSSSEVSGTGYTAGGNTITNATSPATSGTTGIWTPSGNLVWSGLTIASAFDTLLVYNSTQSNRAIAVYNFGAYTISAGTLTLTMPANAAGTALINLA